MDNKKLIPNLRFPEFNNSWEEKKIKNTFSLFNGYAFSSFDSVKNNGTLWVKIADVGINNMKKKNLSYLPKDFLIKNEKFILKEGDYVIALTRPILNGKLKISKIDDFFHNSLLNQRVAKIITKNNSNFIFNLLKGERLIKSIENNIAGSDPPNLSPKDINNINILIPQLSEQKKIASFLTEVDSKLTQLTKKKALLEKYKKGVMQKIFNQKIRFKDNKGNNYPKWEEKTLGELCLKAQSGGTPKSTNKSYYDGNIPFLSISDMTSQGKYLKETKKTISKLGINNSSSWLVPKNSLIYSMYASVGFVSINKIEIATSQAVMNIILKDGLNIEFIYYFLIQFQKKIKKYIETGTQGNINASIVKGFLIPIPNIEEQEKIANFLSEIDIKIKSLNTKIENNKSFKKGLLQKMFV